MAKLTPETLIMIDIWARETQKGSPYADITWMAYCGKKPSKDISDTFELVIAARDKVILTIKSMLEKDVFISGQAADSAARQFLAQKKLDHLFLHTTGHPLGFYSAHGKSGGRLRQSNKKPLIAMNGYTDEPGIYFKDKFGVRSEIDFYINEENKLIVTTKAQKDLSVIK